MPYHEVSCIGLYDADLVSQGKRRGARSTVIERVSGSKGSLSFFYTRAIAQNPWAGISSSFGSRPQTAGR